MITRFCAIYICSLIILGTASAGTAQMTGGWSVEGDGQQTDSGVTYLASTTSSDPSITLGISAVSSLFGPGTDSKKWTGAQNIDISMGGFDLSAEYDGTVVSKVILTSEGSASAAAFVGASASGLSTGQVPSDSGGDSYELFGKAEITTEGSISGTGTATATASGSASYDVQKLETSSEAWGQVTGSSNMELESGSSNGVVSTSGTENGLHADSQVMRSLQKYISASSNGQLKSYASIVNEGNANVKTSGEVKGGAWDPTFTGTKVRTDTETGNEDVAISAEGTLGTLDQEIATNDDGDAASVSSILQAAASKELSAAGDLTLSVSGGPATYAAVSQTSSSTETYAAVWVRDALWGSIAKSEDNQKVLEWGQVDSIGSGAICYDPASALGFAKIQMSSDYTSSGGISIATGNMTVSTYAQGTRNTTALGGAAISGDGKGDITTSDSLMANAAGYTGGMDHISFVDAARISSSGTRGYAMTKNIADLIYASTDPAGSALVLKPFQTNSAVDPIYAWSSSEGSYYQAHSV